MLAGWGRKVVKVSMSIDKSTITIMCQSSDAEKIVVTQALLNYRVGLLRSPGSYPVVINLEMTANQFLQFCPPNH